MSELRACSPFFNNSPVVFLDFERIFKISFPSSIRLFSFASWKKLASIEYSNQNILSSSSSMTILSLAKNSLLLLALLVAR
jgi:hypothetical protein